MLRLWRQRAYGYYCEALVQLLQVVSAKNGERLVSQLAKRQTLSNPENTILSIKRHIGTDF